MSETIPVIQKKKRGRKPKIKTEPVEVSVPKKRGRKPKPKPTTEEPKLPKKRGRKPKDTSNIDVKNNFVQINDETVILHLPIKSKLINLNIEEEFVKYNPNIVDPLPFTPEDDKNLYQLNDTKSHLNNIVDDSIHTLDENSEDINNENIDDINIDDNILDNNDNTDHINNITNVENILKESDVKKMDNIKLIISENTDVLEKYDDICESYKNLNEEGLCIERNKVLPIFLEYKESNKTQKWPSSVHIDCLWCCHSFSNAPVGLPYKVVDNTYYMFGNFCSRECAAAYNFDNNYYSDEVWERYSLLNSLYKDFKSENGIKIAPPRLCLKKFGGRLNIKEFRNINNNYNKDYKLVVPPMVSIIPMIEEVNINQDNQFDFSNISKHRINKANEEYRLKRNKPLSDSRNTLEECMNLKYL